MNFVRAYIPDSLVPYYQNGRAKIIFPDNVGLDGFAVWISTKLLKDIHEAGFEFFAPETFTFTAVRSERRGNTWETVEERTLTAQELADAVAGYDCERVRVITLTPEPLAAIENPQPDSDLLR